MFLSKLFNHRHTHEFTPDMSPEDRERQIFEIKQMLNGTDIEATMHVTDEGIEFGFMDHGCAEAFRLNMIAMYGDFGPMTHTQEFDHPAVQQRYTMLAAQASAQLGIAVDLVERDGETAMHFQSSEDAMIMKRVMELAYDQPIDVAIAEGQQMQAQMRLLQNRNLG